MNVEKTIVAVIEDLFFTVKIADAAKRAGAKCTFVKTTEAALASLGNSPAMIVVDLNYSAVDPIELVKQIKLGAHPGVPVIGFVSHVQTELRQRAKDAGYDMVVARSVFSSTLPEIFQQHLA